MELLRFSVYLIAKAKIKFLIHLICVVITSGFTIFIAYFTGLFIDQLIYATTTEFLFVFVLFFILINLLKISSTFIS